MKKMSYVVGALCLAAAVAFAAGTGTITLPRTGVTNSYSTGDDGALRKGAEWPTPRFIDNANGTVTDKLTGLVWLKQANCGDPVGSVTPTRESTTGYYYMTWEKALTWSSGLASGKCGLTDGSTAGQWRMPNRKELQSLVDLSRSNPALISGHPFSNVRLDNIYWSSSSYAGANFYAYGVYMYLGDVGGNGMSNDGYVWPVRD